MNSIPFKMCRAAFLSDSDDSAEQLFLLLIKVNFSSEFLQLATTTASIIIRCNLIIRSANTEHCCTTNTGRDFVCSEKKKFCPIFVCHSHIVIFSLWKFVCGVTFSLLCSLSSVCCTFAFPSFWWYLPFSLFLRLILTARICLLSSFSLLFLFLFQSPCNLGFFFFLFFLSFSCSSCCCRCRWSAL